MELYLMALFIFGAHYGDYLLNLYLHFQIFMRFVVSILTAVQLSVIMYGRRFVMNQTKLTVRVPRELLDNIKQYAAQNNTTLTNLIEAYLRRIPVQIPLDDAPIVRRISGALPKDVTIQDYRDHLEEKYG